MRVVELVSRGAMRRFSCMTAVFTTLLGLASWQAEAQQKEEPRSHHLATFTVSEGPKNQEKKVLETHPTILTGGQRFLTK